MKNSITSKLKSSGFWQLIEVVGLMIAQFAYFTIMARLIDKDSFGLMAILNAFIAFGAVFAEGGMSAALIQRKSITDRHINAALQGSLLFGGLMYAILILVKHWVAVFYEQPELVDLLPVMGVNFVLLAVSSVSISLMHKRYMFKNAAISTVLASFIGYGLGIFLGLNDYGVWSLVFGTLVFSFLKTIFYISLAPFKLKFGFFITEWKSLFGFGSGMILLKIANFCNNNGVNLLLGKILSASSLGIFDRANYIKNLPSKYLGHVLDRIMFPVMSELQDENIRIFKVYQHGLGLSNALMMPLSVFLIFNAREIVLILLGENWMESVVPLQIMFGILALSISGRMADSVVRSKGLIYLNVKRKYAYVIVLMISLFLGSYYFGVLGAALAVLISQFINYVFIILLVKQIFNKSFKTIFIEPLKSAFLLSFVVLVLCVIYKSILGLWGGSNLISFFSFSAILGIALAIIAFKRPKLLGEYIFLTLSKIRN